MTPAIFWGAAAVIAGVSLIVGACFLVVEVVAWLDRSTD